MSRTQSRLEIAPKNPPKSDSSLVVAHVLRDHLRTEHPAHHFLIGLLHIAQVTAEAVLVQLLVGPGVPEAAGIGGDLVSQNDSAIGQAAKLQLEVDEPHAALGKKGLQYLVDLQSHGADGLDLLPCRQLQGQSVRGVQQRIVEVIVLVGELEGGLIEGDALLHAVAFGEAPGGDIADDDLQGNDPDLLHHGLPIVQLLDKVGGNAGGGELAHEEVAHAVVHRALAPDGSFFCPVESGGIVLVGDDDQIGILGGKDFFCLALIELFFLFHIVLTSII